MFARASRHCRDVALGCAGVYIVAADMQMWAVQEKRKARQQEIRIELLHRKAKLLAEFHDFKIALQTQGAIQAATDSGKLALAVLPGGGFFGQTIDSLNDANNLHDLFLLLSGVKDICDLETDEETTVLNVLARNDAGHLVIKSLLKIERLDSELNILCAANWFEGALPSLCMPWRWFATATQQYWSSGNTALDDQGHEEAEAELAKIFEIMDNDGDGAISQAEFERALTLLGGEWNQLSKAYALEFFKKADVDGDGEVSLGDFTVWLKTTRDLIVCFKSEDSDRDGEINEAEFAEVLRKTKEKLPELGNIDVHFTKIDIDRDGRINLPDFVGSVQGDNKLGFRAACMRMLKTVEDHSMMSIQTMHAGTRLFGDLKQQGISASAQLIDHSAKAGTKISDDLTQSSSQWWTWARDKAKLRSDDQEATKISDDQTNRVSQWWTWARDRTKWRSDKGD